MEDIKMLKAITLKTRWVVLAYQHRVISIINGKTGQIGHSNRSLQIRLLPSVLER
jgi:hypothetical protein